MRRNTLSTQHTATWRAVLVLAAILLLAACEGGNEPTAPVTPPTTPPSAVGTLSGRVFNFGQPVAGATVSVGSVTATTDADGRFELRDLSPGPATLRCIANGFEDYETNITVGSGSTSWSLVLTRIELFEFGEFALYVPATAVSVRGVILALGGPDTRAFSSRGPFGAPIPEVEASLQALGQGFRSLAATHRLAVLGTSRAAMRNATESDQLLLEALQEFATMSGRPELASAPLLMYGMSSGAPQASGFTARNPERVVGLFLKVPGDVEFLRGGTVLGVPTFMVLAELDAFVDNAALEAAFRGNRGAGALWGMALERAVPHHSLTSAQRNITTHWMHEILGLRLGPPSGPLRPVDESTGWLGDPAVGANAWTGYLGDRASASWFPSQSMADAWRSFVGVRAEVGSVAIHPASIILHVGQSHLPIVTVRERSGREIPYPQVTVTSDRQDVAMLFRASDELCGWAGQASPCSHVTGVAPGEATITAEFGGVTAAAIVTVPP